MEDLTGNCLSDKAYAAGTDIVYSETMKRIGKALMSLAAIMLLAVQASGVHLHAESNKHSENIDHGHGIHVVHDLASEHRFNDHTEHVDLDVADILLKFSPYDFVSASVQPWHLPVAAATRTCWSLPQSNAPAHCRLRIRPPLRAPPTLT